MQRILKLTITILALSLTGCGISTKKIQPQVASQNKEVNLRNSKNKDEANGIKRIDLSKFYLKPIKDLSFNSKGEILKSLEIILKYNNECSVKLNKLRKEVIEYDKIIDNLLLGQKK